MNKNVKIALVHDWLTGMRGGEKVLECLCELWPDADLLTLLHVKGKVSPTIERHKIKTSFIQRMPRAARYYRNFLPLFPVAIEQFDMRGYDLVISTSHCVAKGIITQPSTLHVSYIHTPMRYVWEMYDVYFGPERVRGLRRLVIPPISNYLRMWDVASAHRVDDFIANSKHVARRIQKHYDRPSVVINPPVDTEMFDIGGERGDYFLMVSALTPYKRIDLAIEAFNELGWPLKIVGIGEDLEKLRRIAKPNVEMLGWQEDEQIRELYAGCRAFIFPGEEDFGITPLEAQASGRPVIAFGRGGALETILGRHVPAPGRPDPLEGETDAITGLFFAEQSSEHLVRALRYFEAHEGRFDPQAIRKHATSFNRERFKDEMAQHVEQVWTAFLDRSRTPLPV
ncbi:MAG: glycosyltransferase [Candidatus Alcyoniella australis]|nr:glycosyltransferase [Candidatus Alcyoniella australis]